jgi:malonyl-CoA O-methyltransferase
VWRHWLPLLRRRCNVILLDLPGFGRSLAQTALTADQLLDQLFDYVPRNAALLGWSLGGNLALAFSERFPDHCGALMTLACNPSFIAHGDWLPGMPADMFRQFQADLLDHPEATLRRFLGLQTRGSDGERQLLRWLRDVGNGTTDVATLQWGLHILAQLDARAALEKCTLPGVHIYGSADVLVPSAVARAAGVLNEEHWMVLMDRAAHLPFVSHPELCWQHLDRLLAAAKLLKRPPPQQRTKQAVAASFSRAATTYDDAAALQRAVARQLLDHFTTPPGSTVLDLGCGTGAATAHLSNSHSVIALDLAEGMLQYARSRVADSRGEVRWLCGDAESLPLADESIDAVFSSLAVQWCENPGAVFTELSRVLRPGGSAWISTLGPGTLRELRTAWAAVDDRVHVNQFAERQLLVDAARRAGLHCAAFRESDEVMRYAELRQLTRELKALGAHNVNTGRPGGLVARSALQRFSAAYEAQRNADGNLPATYQVYYLQVTKPLPAPDLRETTEPASRE